MTTTEIPTLRPHERRVCRTFESRGQPGLGEALTRLDGTRLGDHFRLDSLYAAGGEGVVFLARDEHNPSARLVAKIALVPFHRPVELSSNFLRRRREQLREEARNLDASRSRFMPRHLGLHEFRNPLLDTHRGGEFTAPEPALVMEWMPGFDLDLWLARMHRSDVPVQLLRRNLDRVAVVVLMGLVDLEEHGFLYADLRPGNLRMMGRPERRVRFLDAGSLVERGDESGRFPHVPAYLPPDLFKRRQATGETIFPTPAIQAVMAGRTLFEVATGRVPLPGEEVDRDLLKDSHVSAPVADVIDGLMTGSYHDVRPALRYLEKRAVKRVQVPVAAGSSAASPVAATHESPAVVAEHPETAAAPSEARAAAPAVPAGAAPVAVARPVVHAAGHAGPDSAGSVPSALPAASAQPAPRPVSEQILPQTRDRPWWKRLLGVK